MTIRDELLDIIVGAIPDTEENQEFCASDSFSVMLDKCIRSIRDNFVEILEG